MLALAVRGGAVKVGYLDLDGYRQTAYLDEDEPTGGVMRGTHKHTDEEVFVVWDDDKEDWLEVEGQ